MLQMNRMLLLFVSCVDALQVCVCVCALVVYMHFHIAHYKSKLFTADEEPLNFQSCIIKNEDSKVK